MRSKLVLSSLMLAAAAGAVPANAAVTRTVTKHYLGAPASVGVTFCGNPRAGADGTGRVCYLLVAGETTMHATIGDGTGLPVAGRIVFFGRETELTEPLDVVGEASFCGASAEVAIPAAATHLDVEVGDRAQSVMPCGQLTSGTYGIVTAVFSNA